MAEYPHDWRCATVEEALASLKAFGLYPDEMKRLAADMPAVPTGGLIHASVTLRQAGTIGMVAAIGHESEQFCPGIYVFDARDHDALRWFNSRRAATEYYDCLVAAAG